MMKQDGIQPNVVIYSTIIKILDKLKLVMEAQGLLSQMVVRGIPQMLSLTLISRFCIVGQLKHAIDLLSYMARSNISPNVNAFNTLVDAYLKEGRVKEAKIFLAIMLKYGLHPDVVT